MNIRANRRVIAFLFLLSFCVVHASDRAAWIDVPLPDGAALLGGQSAWTCPVLGVLLGVELLFGQVWAAAGTAVAAGLAGCI
jgi:hypothetical protein